MGGARSLVRDGMSRSSWKSWLPYLVAFGLYLTFRGYHSFDGDQAYRLPLLLHRQDPSVFADDPFVRAFDDFNPHRGSLALLDGVSRLAGLPAGLFLVFAGTFLLTCRAVVRLAGAVWPNAGRAVGWVAVGLFLAAKAGNIGTNHLFEAMVLDRLVALALGWWAIAEAVSNPSEWRRPAIAIGLAAIVHPSIGLQLALVLASSAFAWAIFGRVDFREAFRGSAWLALAIIPGLAINLDRGGKLIGDLPASTFWILSVELQNPQHMLPHLWRMPQWLSWFAFLVLAALSMGRPRPEPLERTNAARLRLTIMLGTIVIGLGAAWYAIEVLNDIRATVFQPFRMGTVARGLALVLIAGRVWALWQRSGWLDRLRAAALAAGFLGEWRLVVVAMAELAASIAEGIGHRSALDLLTRKLPVVAWVLVMSTGLDFLGHHDTASGHIPMLAVLALVVVLRLVRTRTGLVRVRDDVPIPRLAVVGVLAWIVPVGAMLAALIPIDHRASRLAIVQSLIDRCRFGPTPMDDIERLAVWCREQTPADARFIGPPGPKTFRLWSRRNLAFCRSGSPYHGEGLADWFGRFQDHVDFHATPEEFVRAYRTHRHEFEARYDALSDAQRAALAVRQGAEYVIATAPKESSSGPLDLLHVEGEYAVYRVKPESLVHRHR